MRGVACPACHRRAICCVDGMKEPIDNSAAEPTRGAIDALSGPTLLEFGTSWCGHCRAAQPSIASALAAYPDVRHIKVEDGSGQPLGRSFGVKLWPTLIFLADGSETTRLVRPREPGSISDALRLIARSR